LPRKSCVVTFSPVSVVNVTSGAALAVPENCHRLKPASEAMATRLIRTFFIGQVWLELRPDYRCRYWSRRARCPGWERATARLPGFLVRRFQTILQLY